jgi:hypothetical protein
LNRFEKTLLAKKTIPKRNSRDRIIDSISSICYQTKLWIKDLNETNQSFIGIRNMDYSCKREVNDEDA